MGGGLPTLDTMGEHRAGRPSPNANIYWIDYDQLVAVKAYLTITNQHRIGIKYLFRLGKKGTATANSSINTVLRDIVPPVQVR